ncbi:MAG: transposase [Nitrospiraceae bacterium]
MARKPRVDFPGAFSHVIVRGNRRAVIFHDDADYRAYLERLERYRTRDGGTLYAYVLMANHVHLLLETGPAPLSRTMQTLQFTYSQYYNRRYGTTGHVFQGRYQAILCDRDPYLLELVRYLHLNPARVRRPLNPWQYRWSSHRAYLGEGGPVQVNTTRVLEQFHRQLGPARQAYRRFLKAGLAQGHEEKFYDTVDQRFLGDARFIQDVDRRTASRRESARPAARIPFGTLLTTVAQIHRTRPAVLLAPGRQRAGGPARAMLVYVAREWGGLTTRELGKRLHRDPSMMSRLYAAYAAQRDAAREATLKRALAQ